MKLASHSSFALLVMATLGCAVACGDNDDDTTDNGTAGSTATAGKSGSGGTTSQAGSVSKAVDTTAAGAGGSGAGEVNSQLCTDLGGPTNIDAVVRGDGKTSKTDPFNGFKFEKDGRQASVLLNVATDPCIGQQFAHLLAPEKAAELEHLAECLSLFVQNTAGCAVAYDGATDNAGKICKPMKSAHLGLGITEEDYTALIMDAATALIAAGVAADSEQFKTVAAALTADDLKADIITNDAAAFSQPSDMCEAAGGTGAGGAAAGEAGGAP
jgi:hypothetical protein